MGIIGNNPTVESSTRVNIDLRSLAIAMPKAGVTVAEDDDWDDMPGLSAPARRALTDAGYMRLGQLVTATQKEVRDLHGMGLKAFEVLRRRLVERGLAFADSA